MSSRLVIVDDHALVRRGFARTVEDHDDLFLVGEAASAAEAWPLIRALRPDVVVLDSALPDGGGARLTARLRAAYPGLGIVVLDSGSDAGLGTGDANRADSVVLGALEAGASAVVVQTAPVEQVIAAVRHAAVAPGSFTAAGLAQVLGRRSHEAKLLSPREREVLEGLQQGLSVPAVARRIHVSESTAKTYVARLYEKLGASNRTQALLAALRMGLIRNDVAPVPAAVGEPAAEELLGHLVLAPAPVAVAGYAGR